MAVSELVNLSALLDDAKCFDLVRQHRWPQGVRCPDCDSAAVIRNGHDETQPHRQRYLCKACHGRFDDLTDTVLAGHHQPLRVWVLCLYLMGLNLSNRQIAAELGLGTSDVQAMTEHLRNGLVARTPAVTLCANDDETPTPCEFRLGHRRTTSWLCPIQMALSTRRTLPARRKAAR